MLAVPDTSSAPSTCMAREKLGGEGPYCRGYWNALSWRGFSIARPGSPPASQYTCSTGLPSWRPIAVAAGQAAAARPWKPLARPWQNCL